MLPAGNETKSGEIRMLKRARAHHRGGVTVVLLSIVLLHTGCASVKHLSASQATDDADRGIRYYETSPYLLVYPQPGGSAKIEIHHLPDPTRRRSTQIKAWGGAKVRTELAFEKGCLVSSRNETAASEPPVALLAAVEELLPLLALMNLPQEESALPAPSIYKFVTDPQGGLHLYGTPGTNTVWLPVMTAEGGAK